MNEQSPVQIIQAYNELTNKVTALSKLVNDHSATIAEQEKNIQEKKDFIDLLNKRILELGLERENLEVSRNVDLDKREEEIKAQEAKISQGLKDVEEARLAIFKEKEDIAVKKAHLAKTENNLITAKHDVEAQLSKCEAEKQKIANLHETLKQADAFNMEHTEHLAEEKVLLDTKQKALENRKEELDKEAQRLKNIEEMNDKESKRLSQITEHQEELKLLLDDQTAKLVEKEEVLNQKDYELDGKAKRIEERQLKLDADIADARRMLERKKLQDKVNLDD